MPRPPPRPLCLPELVSNPQTRADFVLANPPRFGPSSSLYSDSPYAPTPSSPTSTTNDADSHSASGATLASLNSPVTPASSRTSLSVHNLPWNGDTSGNSGIGDGLLSMPGNTSEGKTWINRLNFRGGTPVVSQKSRASWSSAFVTTKAWFGATTTAESAEATPSASSQKEIKLSPSMIAASGSGQSMLNRPVSSPYPSSSDVPILSPTCSPDNTQSPKVGTGLRYYSERNPAPAQARAQIPDPIDLQDHDRPQSPRLPSQRDASAPTSAFPCSTFSTPVIPDVAVQVPSAILQQTTLKDTGMSRCENTGPLSPPPTPPVHGRESDVPRIRVSFGENS